MTSEDVAAEGGLLARWHRRARHRGVNRPHRPSSGAARACIPVGAPVTSSNCKLRQALPGRTICAWRDRRRSCGRTAVAPNSVTGGVRVPTSVLLAVLAAAGLLALAPALVRRYDATERLVAERAKSTARVLPAPPAAPHCARTAAGQPVRARSSSPSVTTRPPARPSAPVSAPPAAPPLRPAARRAGRAERSRRRPPPRRQHTPAVYRRRRVLAALLLLNVVELVGVVAGQPRLLDRLRGHRRAAGRCTSSTCAAGRSPSAAAGAPRPARRPGWPPGRPRCAGSRPAGPRPAGRRSAAWPPSARRYAEPRWAWTGRPTCRRRPAAARSPTGGRAACAAAPTRPAAAPDARLTAVPGSTVPAGLIDSGS